MFIALIVSPKLDFQNAQYNRILDIQYRWNAHWRRANPQSEKKRGTLKNDIRG